MKRFGENVPQQLGEILIRHGRSPLTDATLCQNLLKDYCPEYKEEIALLALAVKERIASDLLVSQEGLQRDLLRTLLVKRLRKARSLSEGDARWAVESWTVAIRALARSESKSAIVAADETPPTQLAGSNPRTTFGILGVSHRPIRSVAALDQTLVSGGDDGVIRLWPPGTVLNRFDTSISALSLSPNGVLLASACGPEIYVIDLQSGEAMWLGQIGKQPSLVFSPGGRSLASTSTDSPCEINVWNLQTGGRRVLKGAGKGPTSITFSPDGKAIAAADSDLSNPSIRLWDLEAGTARVVGRSTRQITSVAFLSAGKHVASGSWDETVRVWNVQTGEARTLGENCSCITHLAVSPDGRRIAASSLDGRIRVWDVETGRSRPVGECYGVNAMAFPNALVTASEDGTLRSWDTDRF